jgi:hypothetical protein
MPIQLKPYVSIGVSLSKSEQRAAFGKFTNAQGLTPSHLLRVARGQLGIEPRPAKTKGSRELVEISPEADAAVAGVTPAAPPFIEAEKPTTEQTVRPWVYWTLGKVPRFTACIDYTLMTTPLRQEHQRPFLSTFQPLLHLGHRPYTGPQVQTKQATTSE